MGNTILPGERTEEQLTKESAEQLDWKRLTILLDICYEHYTDPATKADLARFCRMLVDISDGFDGDGFDCAPAWGRDRLIGERVYKAVQYDQGITAGKTPVSNKTVFKELVSELVDEAHRRGYPKTIDTTTSEKEKDGLHKNIDTNTAFKEVAELLYKYGITNKGRKYSSSTISDWCGYAKTDK